MDDFLADRHEFTGSLVSLEFGPAGRIVQLWASDPNLPEEGEEFQFVLPPVNFGEEYSEDYLPGTILLSARTGPEEPWISGRSISAERTDDDSDPMSIGFEYDLGLLSDVRCFGRFFEVPGRVPRVVWEITLRNRGRRSIEVGELAFPMALNNLYEGFGRQKSTGKSIWLDRVYLHKFIGGSASYLFAQRLCAEPPGLLVFPGEETSWEFFAHAATSLETPFRWEGVPVVYIYSKATVEREGWGQWHNEHTSLILEPGDQRTFQTCFVSCERDRFDYVSGAMAMNGKPAIKLLPGAVVPVDVGVAAEVAGVTPTRFYASGDADFETDADEEGGFCFVKAKQPGPLRLSFEDTRGGRSHAHLFFTARIEDLIKARAKWIVKNQVQRSPGSSLDGAILLTNSQSSSFPDGRFEVGSAFAVECGLADACFLAEKNSIYPDKDEILALDNYISDFLRHDLQNPGDDTVGSAFVDPHSVAVNYGRPQIYPLVYSLYQSMAKVSQFYGETKHDARTYLSFAARTALAMFRYAIRGANRNAGLLGNSRVFELLEDLIRMDMQDEATKILRFITMRNADLLRRDFPYAGDNVWDTAGFAEVYAAARYVMDDDHLERASRCAFAARSLSPSWWWYGSDVRQWDPAEGVPTKEVEDNGEFCLGYTTPINSSLFFQSVETDYSHIPEAHMRLAFGGMLGVWALVTEEGAASMGYCPDAASQHFGFSAITGDIGLALFDYLRDVASYVLPSRDYGVFTFGCHFEVEDDCYVVRPWDGVGQRVYMRQIGADFSVRNAKIEEVRLDLRKRWAELSISNPSDKQSTVSISVQGLWGTKFDVNGRTVESNDGGLGIGLNLAEQSLIKVRIMVIE